MKKAIFIGIVLLLSGCKDPYGACVKAGADIATGIGQAYSTIDQLRQQSQITPAEELNIAGYLRFANDADKAFLSCAQTAHTAGSKTGAFTGCATVFSTTLNNPNETLLIHVSNPTVQTQVNAVVQAIVTGVNTVKTALGGA